MLMTLSPRTLLSLEDERVACTGTITLALLTRFLFGAVFEGIVLSIGSRFAPPCDPHTTLYALTRQCILRDAGGG